MASSAALPSAEFSSRSSTTFQAASNSGPSCVRYSSAFDSAALSSLSPAASRTSLISQYVLSFAGSLTVAEMTVIADCTFASTASAAVDNRHAQAKVETVILRIIGDLLGDWRLALC